MVRAKVRVPEVRSLRLDRIERRLADIWERRLGVVVAPAGSGKTTLLAGFARSLDLPVAWYRAETWDTRTSTALRHLHRSVSAALEGRTAFDDHPWESVEQAAESLETIEDTRLLLVVDDLHALEGTPAETALERLVDYAPAHLAVLVASRTQPGFNLPRRRVEGTLLEIGSEDLRFRFWEVERLFRDVYGVSLPPQEVATLARRTEGWAAGLQLFRLAIEGKSAEERRQLLTEGGSSGRFVREYLARNVLADLPAELRSFLVETCVLGRLSGILCDGLLERPGTVAMLEELERRQIFTTRHEDGSFHYHEVLRTHLEAVLIESHGELATRKRYQRAGTLLMAQEEVGEALIAFARAADWDAVERLVRNRGERLVAEQHPEAWLDALPSALARNDPWLLLAAARRARDTGHWNLAAEGFTAAEAAFGSSEGAAIAGRERRAVAPWAEVRLRSPWPGDGSALLRSAVVRDPGAARATSVALDGPWRDLADGLTALLAGRPDEAHVALRRVVDEPDASPALSQGAALGAAVSARLAGVATDQIDGSDPARPDALRTPWLAQLARAASVLGTAPDRADRVEVAGLRAGSMSAGDGWGAILAGLLAGWAGLAEGDNLAATTDDLEATAEGARQLGAGVLETWALGLAAVAAYRGHDPRATDLSKRTEQAGRAAACRPPERLVARLTGANEVDDELVIRLPNPVPRVPPARRPGARIRCFGQFEIEVDGRPVDMTAIRPRARSVLHLLASRAGEAVHREIVEASIWPNDTTGAAAARMHVAISSIRHLLHADQGRPAAVRIDRDREAYRLVVPDDVELDTRDFESAVAEAHVQADRGDPALAASAAERATSLYRGPLLLDEGPAEWVLEPRERYRAQVIEMLELQATLALLRHDPTAAVAACSAGLAMERYHDPFWRLLIEAREKAGDRVAAIRAEADYRSMLAQLGAEPVAATPTAAR